MALVLTEDPFVGWKGKIGAPVNVKVVVAGSSKLVDVAYGAESVQGVVAVDSKMWAFTFSIQSGLKRLIFTFAGMAPDTIDIYEVGVLPTPVTTTSVVAPVPAAVATSATAKVPAKRIRSVIPTLTAAAIEQQEIAGVAHAQAAILAPLIEGV